MKHLLGSILIGSQVGHRTHFIFFRLLWSYFLNSLSNFIWNLSHENLVCTSYLNNSKLIRTLYTAWSKYETPNHMQLTYFEID